MTCLHDNYLNVMFNPLSYIDDGRFRCHSNILSTAYGRSVANEIIIRQYQLPTDNVALTPSSGFLVLHWSTLCDAAFYTGCQMLRNEFLHQGRFLELPQPARNFIRVMLMPADTTYPRAAFDGRQESILSVGYSVFMPSLSILPVSLRQRAVLCFPPYVDKIPLRPAASPMYISQVIHYAKKNPLRLFV